MSRLLRLSLALVLTSFSCFAQSNQSPSPEAQPTPVSTTPPSSDAHATSAAPAVANPLGDARALYRKGDFDAALAKYREILHDHPQSPDAYAGMVHIYLKQKNIDEAARTADLGVTLSTSPRIRTARAEVWFRQGKIDEAEKEWAQIINSGFPEARAYLGLARVRYSVAMYKTGRKMIEKAHELDPNDPDIEERWISTLPRDRRIEYLENALAGNNNWNADRRTNMSGYLQYLKDRSQEKAQACRLVSKTKSTDTPLVRVLQDPQHLRGYGLSVSLNGHKSTLLLDTGAGGLLVTRSVAEHAGISKISEQKIGGIGDKGRKDAFIGVADSVKIGDLEFQNCPVEVIEHGSVIGEDGLIGANVFAKFLVDLDFPDETMKLSELPPRPGESSANLSLENSDESEDDDDTVEGKPAADGEKTAPSKPTESKTPTGPQDRYIAPEMQDYSHIFEFGHYLLIPTKVGDGPYKLFMMDTGAVTNSISPDAAREVTKVDRDTHMHVRGLSGSVEKVYMAHTAVLQFGHLRQENQDMTSFDTTNLSNGAGTEISGFLGFILLRMLDIKIDYRDALVDLHYDPKHLLR